MGSRVLDAELLTQLGMGPIRQRRRPSQRPRPSRPGGRRESEPKLADSFRVADHPVTVQLGFPPMLNHYYRSAIIGGHVSVYLSKEGRAYREHVIQAWSDQAGVTFVGLLVLEIELVFPDKRDRDIDGCLKSLIDGLQHAGAYRDDKCVKGLIVHQEQVRKPGYAIVTVRPKRGVDQQRDLFETRW